MMTNLLPIPELQNTCQRYLEWVKPLLTEEELTQTNKIVRQFLQGNGPKLQNQLQQFATAQQQQYGSWLINSWRDSYLSTNEPLPLVSNVGFRLAWSSEKNALEKLLEFTMAMIGLHADYLNQQLEFSHTPVLQRPFSQQWDILLGAARVPGAIKDEFVFASSTKQARYIVVLWLGRAYAVKVLDEKQQVIGIDNLREALRQIIADTKIADKPDFAALATAPKQQAAELLHELVQDSNNQQVLQILNVSLFHLVLDNSLYEDEQQALATTTFLQNYTCWSYKPTSYCFNLNTDDLILHCEHTWQDAGCLKEIIKLAHQRQNLPREYSKNTCEIKPLFWQLNNQQKQQLINIAQNYKLTANEYNCIKIEVPIDETVLPERISKDGLAQLLLQYAQYVVFGAISNSYEALDMSHYINGRTEAMRPVSVQSVVAVKVMFEQQADIQLIIEALTEHKNRIKACKLGNGINRHLLGLKLMADTLDIKEELFSDVAYQKLTKDIFSTSSIGNQDFIKEFAFAPTSEHGYGVNYSIMPGKFSYLITVKKEQLPQAGYLLRAIDQGSIVLQKVFAQSVDSKR